MNTDLRAYDRRIIEKDRRFLYCVKDAAPVWHWSTHDAWWDRENSGRFVPAVARKLGGRVRVFNPITGEIK